MKGCCSINKKQKITLVCFLPVALAALFYAGGYLAQFIYNYQAWAAEGGTPYSGTSPPLPDAAFDVCLRFVFRFPYGLYGMGIFLAAIVLLVVAIMHMGAGGDGQYDKTRNLTYSHKGTYGTAGFLNPKEAGQVLDFVPDLRKHHGTILGEVDGRVVCIPEKTRFNGNLAVYGASGSKKTRAFCVNMILQCAARKSSLVICDPKSELYEKTSAYLRDQGYTVRVFNLVTPASSDSWNCLSEIDGQRPGRPLLGQRRNESSQSTCAVCRAQLSTGASEHWRGVSAACKLLGKGAERTV